MLKLTGLGVLVAFSCLGGESEPPAELLKQIAAETAKIFPEASIEEKGHELTISFKTREYQVYRASMIGEWSDTPEKETGPKLEGFILALTIVAGGHLSPTHWPADLTFSADKALFRHPYYLTSICVRQYMTHYAGLKLSFGEGADAKVMERIYAKIVELLDAKYGVLAPKDWKNHLPAMSNRFGPDARMVLPAPADVLKEK
jgi:hypothetical protein